jgi:beta-lactamase class C
MSGNQPDRAGSGMKSDSRMSNPLRIRTRSLRNMFGAAALALCCQPATAQQAADGPEDVATAFKAFFLERIAAENVTGAAFAIATPDGIVGTGAAGFTDTSRKQRVDENTVFRVASVSKTFAAGLAGVLVQEGQFSWDDRVVDYVPGFRIKGDSARVRILDLLGQSTGLVPHAYDNLLEEGVPLEQIEQRYRELSYICPPGECYSYQNSIFSLIEPVIEKTAAQPYERLMEEKIFRPLDMQTASIGYEALINSPNYARPHVRSGGQWKTVAVKPNYYRVAPAAGVNASALDMGKWLSAQLGGQPRVLDPAVIATLTLPRVATTRDRYREYWRDMLSEAHYGLGWRIYRLGEHEIAYHSGWVSGYRADIAWSASHGIGIAVLMNVEGNSISELTTTFWRMAFEQLPPAAGQAPRPLVAAASPRTP